MKHDMVYLKIQAPGNFAEASYWISKKHLIQNKP